MLVKVESLAIRPGTVVTIAAGIALIGALLFALTGVRAQTPVTVDAATVQQLIDEIEEANEREAPTIINLTADTYVLSAAYGSDSNGNFALPRINANITIQGGGAELQRAGTFNNIRHFIVGGDGDLHLWDLTLTMASGGVDPNGPLRGGAIYNAFGKVTLNNVVVTENFARIGGGLYNTGEMTLNSSTVSDNLVVWVDQDSVTGAGGGIVNAFNAQMTLNDSTVTGNTARTFAGIVNRGTLTVNRSLIHDNEAEFRSGGAANDEAGSVMTIIDSIVSENQGGQGAGLENTAGSQLTVINSTINDNDGFRGGGIFSLGALRVTNSTISGNTAESWGGGILTEGDARILNSTVFDNEGSEGGGVRIGQSLVMNGTVVAGNSATEDDSDDIFSVGTATIAGSYNLIGDADGQDVFENGVDNNIVGINVGDILDPAGLQDNGGPTETIALLDTLTNPAIDHIPDGEIGCGDPAAEDPILTDQRGYPRPFGQGCDIGAYELQPPIVFVDQSVTGGLNNGSSWEDAFDDLQDGLEEADDLSSGGTIPIMVLVAEGEYLPTANSANRNASFEMRDNVAVYGGFPTGGGTFADRDFQTFESVLSGDINDSGDLTGNSYTVVSVESGVTASIDGVTITGGNADSAPTLHGGGIVNGGDLFLARVTVRGNNAHTSGGGVFNTGDLELTNSLVHGNAAGTTGGGIDNYTGALTLTNSTISGNSASVVGGISIFDGALTLTNSTISGNSASVVGGISIIDGALTLTNSIVWGNAATDIEGSGTATVSHAIIGTGNVSCDPADQCSSGDPMFVGPLDLDSVTLPTTDGDYRLLPGSPAINTGDNDAYDATELGNEDLDGNPRIVGGTVDLGAYEAQFSNQDLSISAPSPVPFGQPVMVTVQLTADNLPPELAELSVVTISGIGPDREVQLDASGSGSTTYQSVFSGTYLLTASVGELSDSTSIHILLPDEDDDTDEPPPPVDVEPEEPGGPTLRNVPQHIVLDALTPAGAILTYSVPTSTDVDGSPLEVVCEPPPGTWVPIGHTTVHCSATNSNDITTSASFGVTVRAFQATDFDHSDQIDNPWFWRTWARTDLPVRDLHVSRTWMWGPGPFTGSLWEPYTTDLQNPGGDPVFLESHPQDAIPETERETIYFDKARMEINDPDGDSDSIWFVTNGLLVIEMITGNRQFGDDLFIAYEPSYSNVAGDADDLHGPTYASFQGVLDAPAQPIGTLLTEQIDRYGNVTTSEAWGDYNVTVGYVDDVTNHSIAGPFWEFMNSHGLIYSDGNLLEEALFENPFYATGRPVTEAYWAEVKVAGAQRDVLIQCFERRCLTYTPGNSEGFVVEAGNVGQHYYHWRYVQAPD